MVTINGEKVNVAGMKVSEYLEQNGYDLQKIAVELNEDILPKSKYADTVLNENDFLEVVSFVGGG
ncbi:MAG: sulfur carrier protein ThiS [Eubacterium sp.]|nr:sulfur carrier protein ThiS [Eubacterium sp.]